MVNHICCTIVRLDFYYYINVESTIIGSYHPPQVFRKFVLIKVNQRILPAALFIIINPVIIAIFHEIGRKTITIWIPQSRGGIAKPGLKIFKGPGINIFSIRDKDSPCCRSIQNCQTPYGRNENFVIRKSYGSSGFRFAGHCIPVCLSNRICEGPASEYEGEGHNNKIFHKLNICLLKLVNDATDQLKSDGEIIATSELTGK